MLRPSSLPMLQACPRFVAGETGDDASFGTARHQYLSALIACHASGNDIADVQLATRSWKSLSDEDSDACHWAFEYIKVHAPISQHPIAHEETLSLLDADFQPIITGTPDVVCGRHLFDLKWRRRDYRAQMAAYALMRMDNIGVDEIHVHILFGEPHSVEAYTITRSEAANLVMGIIGRVELPSNPTPCDYCGWCANQATCPALTEKVLAVAAGREDWQLKTYHTSDIDDPVEMAKALTIARLMADWCEAVKYRALNMVTKEGKSLPGYELKEKAGRQWVTDIAQAFGIIGLPQEDFFKACDLRITGSKKYADKVGIVDLYVADQQRKLGVKVKAAPTKRALLDKLAPVLRQAPSSQYLKAVNSTTENEETE